MGLDLESVLSHLGAAREHGAEESVGVDNCQQGVCRPEHAPDFERVAHALVRNQDFELDLLALGVGAKRGVPIDDSVWMKIMDHFVKGQQKEGPKIDDRLQLRPPEERGIKRQDIQIVKKGSQRKKGSGSSKKKGEDSGPTGVVTAVSSEDPEIGTESFDVFQRGWDYQHKGGATWNMTCAGLSSLLLARESLRGKLTADAKKTLDKAIWDGYGWVMGHWSPNSNYYGMYSLEKVGDIGEVVKFGSHDWYEEMSQHLLGNQRENGSWAQGQWAESDALATAYALLILNRATSLLAMDRSNKIVMSGRRGSGATQEDRNWVYIRSIDTSLHAPTLMRAIRLRPNPKLIRFLEKVVESYPDTYRGELVPELVSVRDAVESKAAQKIIDEYLTIITGYKYDDPETYMKWTRRWKRVLEMGESLKPEYKGELLKYYKSTTKSIPLKRLVMWALVQCKVREAIPLFLEDLSHEEAAVRREAYSKFRDFFIEFPPPFSPTANETTRERQIAAIKAWYAKQS